MERDLLEGRDKHKKLSSWVPSIRSARDLVEGQSGGWAGRVGGSQELNRWNRVPAGPGRCLKPGSHCSHHVACLGPHLLPVQVTPDRMPCSALHSLPHVPLDPGLASRSHTHPRPGPWGHQDLMNCRVTEAAFGPRSVAEEINTINGENLDCDVEIWEGVGGHVTACPPAGVEREGHSKE